MTKENELKKQLAKKYGLTLGQVNEAVMMQDKFVADVLSKKVDREAGYFPAVRLPGFGIFFCPDKVREKFIEVNKKKNATI